MTTNPFGTKGAFAANIRAADAVNAEPELRESLKRFGWIAEFPALADEHDVVLVGHRRLKIAAEEGIAPVIKKLTLGRGEAADAERVKLALASNIGGAPFTKADRQRIAERLYGDCEWTMARIAEALGVNQRMISRDLEGLDIVSKPSRPKGGRPKAARPSRAQDRARNVALVIESRGETPTRQKVMREASVRHTPAQIGIALLRDRQQFMAEEKLIPVSEIIQRLRPLFKEVREQGKRHIAMVALPRLVMIAFEAERIFEAWANGEATPRRTAAASPPRKVRRGVKK